MASKVNWRCFLLGHQWHFLLSEVGYVPLYGWPARTTCLRCGIPHPRPLPDHPPLPEVDDD